MRRAECEVGLDFTFVQPGYPGPGPGPGGGSLGGSGAGSGSVADQDGGVRFSSERSMTAWRTEGVVALNVWPACDVGVDFTFVQPGYPGPGPGGGSLGGSGAGAGSRPGRAQRLLGDKLRIPSSPLRARSRAQLGHARGRGARSPHHIEHAVNARPARLAVARTATARRGYTEKEPWSSSPHHEPRERRNARLRFALAAVHS